MASRVFTIANFPFASARINSARDKAIRDIDSLLKRGDPPIPSIKGLSQVVVIGHGRGSKPQKWADRRAAAVTARLIELLKKSPTVSVSNRLKIVSGFSGTKVTSQSDSQPADRKVEVLLEWNSTKPKKKTSKKKPQ